MVIYFLQLTFHFISILGKRFEVETYSFLWVSVLLSFLVSGVEHLPTHSYQSIIIVIYNTIVSICVLIWACRLFCERCSFLNVFAMFFSALYLASSNLLVYKWYTNGMAAVDLMLGISGLQIFCYVFRNTVAIGNSKKYFIHHVLFLLMGYLSFRCFVQPTANKVLAPWLSRNLNSSCILFGFFDVHDLWHFLSTIAIICAFTICVRQEQEVDAVHCVECEQFFMKRIWIPVRPPPEPQTASG